MAGELQLYQEIIGHHVVGAERTDHRFAKPHSHLFASIRGHAAPVTTLELALRGGYQNATAADRISALVGIESAAGLFPELARGDHPAQERAGAVLVVAQAAVEHLHDGPADVEAD